MKNSSLARLKKLNVNIVPVDTRFKIYIIDISVDERDVFRYKYKNEIDLSSLFLYADQLVLIIIN